jgi:hypothetical protein
MKIKTASFSLMTVQAVGYRSVQVADKQPIGTGGRLTVFWKEEGLIVLPVKSRFPKTFLVLLFGWGAHLLSSLNGHRTRARIIWSARLGNRRSCPSS